MIKTIYFTHLFSVVTLLIFISSFEFNIINTTLFIISALANTFSIYLLIFKTKTLINKSKLWFFMNGITNLFFLSLMSYIAFMSYQLTFA